MCGTSCASYCTVTGALSPGIVLAVSVGGAIAMSTEAMSSPARAVTLAVPVPGGGVKTTCSPDSLDSVPLEAVHVTSALVLTSTAVSCVGPVIWSGLPDGVMLSSAGGSVVLQAENETRAQAIARIGERIKASQGRRGLCRLCAHERARALLRPELYQTWRRLVAPSSPDCARGYGSYTAGDLLRLVIEPPKAGD